MATDATARDLLHKGFRQHAQDLRQLADQLTLPPDAWTLGRARAIQATRLVVQALRDRLLPDLPDLEGPCVPGDDAGNLELVRYWVTAAVPWLFRQYSTRFAGTPGSVPVSDGPTPADLVAGDGPPPDAAAQRQYFRAWADACAVLAELVRARSDTRQAATGGKACSSIELFSPQELAAIEVQAAADRARAAEQQQVLATQRRLITCVQNRTAETVEQYAAWLAQLGALTVEVGLGWALEVLAGSEDRNLAAAATLVREAAGGRRESVLATLRQLQEWQRLPLLSGMRRDPRAERASMIRGWLESTPDMPDGISLVGALCRLERGRQAEAEGHVGGSADEGCGPGAGADDGAAVQQEMPPEVAPTSAGSPGGAAAAHPSLRPGRLAQAAAKAELSFAGFGERADWHADRWYLMRARALAALIRRIANDGWLDALALIPPGTTEQDCLVEILRRTGPDAEPAAIAARLRHLYLHDPPVAVHNSLMGNWLVNQLISGEQRRVVTAAPAPAVTGQGKPTVPATRGRGVRAEVVAPDKFYYGDKLIKDLTLLEWRLLACMCAGGALRPAVPWTEAIACVYELEHPDKSQIARKRDAFKELCRRLQKKLDAAAIKLLFSTNNDFLQLTPL